MQQQIARHFEHHVADKEDAAREAEHGGAEAERLVHVERRETDVDAVKIVEEHHREEQGHEPPVYLSHGCCFVERGHAVSTFFSSGREGSAALALQAAFAARLFRPAARA